MLLDKRQACRYLGLLRRPAEGQLDGSGNLFRLIIACVPLHPNGKIVRHAEREGVVEQRKRLQRCRGRASLGSRRGGIRTIESVEQRILAAAGPHSVNAPATVFRPDEVLRLIVLSALVL